jgi:hypothetical protein
MAREVGNHPMTTALTPASNGCNPETGGGQKHVRSKAPKRGSSPANRRQVKVRTANARLREVQDRALTRRGGEKMTDTPARTTGRGPHNPGPNLLVRHGRHSRKIRTDCLTAPHVTEARRWDRLCGCSPHPAWRQSCHSSQTPGVMPGTATKMDGCGRKRPGNREREARHPGEGKHARETTRLDEAR